MQRQRNLPQMINPESALFNSGLHENHLSGGLTKTQKLKFCF